MVSINRMFTVYDQFSRVAVTGMCDDHAMTSSAKIPSMTAVLDDSFSFPSICNTSYLAGGLEYLQNTELLTAAITY